MDRKKNKKVKCSEQELIALATSGDRRAATTLMRRYRTRIKWWVTGKYGTAIMERDDFTVTVDDVVSESFAKAFRYLLTYDSAKGNFSTWLHTIAKNVAIDAVRRKSLPTSPFDIDIDTGKPNDDAMDTNATSPEHDLIMTQGIQATRRAIESLPEFSKYIIKLVYFAGYGYDEAAIELGIPIGTLKAELFRAKAMLVQAGLSRT